MDSLDFPWTTQIKYKKSGKWYIGELCGNIKRNGVLEIVFVRDGTGNYDISGKREAGGEAVKEKGQNAINFVIHYKFKNHSSLWKGD